MKNKPIFYTVSNVRDMKMALKDYEKNYKHLPVWVHHGILLDETVLAFLERNGFETEQNKLLYAGEILLGE